MPIIRVALDVPLSTLFDYVVEQNTEVMIGQRVLVPFGRKQVLGVAMECVEQSDLSAARIKPVTQVLDDVPPLPQELLTLLQFCSDYYHHPLGMTVLSALPTRLRALEPVALKQSLDYTLSASRQGAGCRHPAQAARGAAAHPAGLAGGAPEWCPVAQPVAFCTCRT